MTFRCRRRLFFFVLGFLGLAMILIRSSNTPYQLSHFIPKQTELYLTSEHVNGTCYDLSSRIWSSPKAAMWPNNPHEPASSPPPPSRPLTHLVAFIQQHSYMNHNHSSSSSPPPSTSGITQAVCKFRKLGARWMDDDVMWQQVTRCFAYWQALSEEEYQAVFWIPASVVDSEATTLSSRFWAIPRLLQAVFGVQVVVRRVDEDWGANKTIVARPLFVYDSNLQNNDGDPTTNHQHPFAGFAMRQIQDARFFRDFVQAHFQLLPLSHAAASTSYSSCHKPQPTAALVVTTPSTPQLWTRNGAHIVQELQNAGHNIQLLNMTTDHSFLKQMEMFSKFDLVVLPSSEKSVVWTGVGFLPNCGGIIEVVPRVFTNASAQSSSSMAQMMGISHLSVYDAGETTENQATTDTTCRFVKAIIEAMEQLTIHWRSCCHLQNDSKSLDTPPVKPPLEVGLDLTTHDGCLSLTANPEPIVTQYPKEYRLDELVEFVPQNYEPSVEPRQAVCVFQEKGYWSHFPHAVQQLFRCFSFWQSYPQLKPWLVFEPSLPKHLKFVWKIREILKIQFGVNEVGNRTDIPSNSLVVQPVFALLSEDEQRHTIVMQNATHVKLFRQKTTDYLNLTSFVGGCRADKKRPVIGILNRLPASQRSLVNLELLQERLQKCTDSQVEVYYFEKMPWADQVETFLNVDILVSPHGAQLSAMNFMPRCGGVVELFPPSYYLPRFFGSLAAVSGLNHGFVYTGYDLEKEWDLSAKHSLDLRTHARSLDICVRLNATLDLVERFVNDWKSCCGIR